MLISPVARRLTAARARRELFGSDLAALLARIALLSIWGCHSGGVLRELERLYGTRIFHQRANIPLSKQVKADVSLILKRAKGAEDERAF
jgi:hypothetical protein